MTAMAHPGRSNHSRCDAIRKRAIPRFSIQA
jgi:hypothetical protein